MSESEHRMIEILRILNNHDKPIGSKVIANELRNKGYNLGERAVDIICKFLMKRDIPSEKVIQAE